MEQTPQPDMEAYWDKQIVFAEAALDYAIRQRRLIDEEVTE